MANHPGIPNSWKPFVAAPARLAEPCTTPAKTKLHYSTDLHPDKHAPRRPGRSGRTLCGNSAMDERRASWERGRLLLIAKLPVCKTCVKAKDARP